MRHCAECRDGEHDNYDDDIRLSVVRDPDTGKRVKQSNLCEHHREAYRQDGYDVTTH